MPVSQSDAEQNERLARVEQSCDSLGRSIDGVRDQLQEHERECAHNWRNQHKATASIGSQLRIVLWILGGIGTTVLAVALELGFGLFFGGE